MRACEIDSWQSLVLSQRNSRKIEKNVKVSSRKNGTIKVAALVARENAVRDQITRLSTPSAVSPQNDFLSSEEEQTVKRWTFFSLFTKLKSNG